MFESKDTLLDNLTAKTGKIGIRIPEHPIALALVNALDNPITATSANVSGNEGCFQIIDIDLRIKNKVDFILDGGILAGGAGSTVVDVSSNFPKILRQGVVPSENIFDVLRERSIGK